MVVKSNSNFSISLISNYLTNSFLIHELDRETNTRKIEIHYSFVGQVDTEQEPTQVVNHDRRNMVDVKSIAI